MRSTTVQTTTDARPMPDLRIGDVVLDNSGHRRQVISFGDERMACSQNHVSHPGSRIVFAVWLDPVRWQNPEQGSAVWEHTLRYCVAMGS